MRYLCLPCLLLAATFSLLACGSRLPAERPAHTTTEVLPDTPTPAKPAAAEAPDEIALWREAVLAAAADYATYTKVADYPKWAPTMCAAPRPTVQFMSKAESSRAHGRKLYFLWVKERGYGAEGETPQTPGQVIVKESFHPVEDAAGAITAGGKSYKPGERAPLFVMMRFEDDKPGTDRGWIYATLTEDGKRVTSAGKVASCMGCHEDAGDDRVFGVRADMND